MLWIAIFIFIFQVSRPNRTSSEFSAQSYMEDSVLFLSFYFLFGLSLNFIELTLFELTDYHRQCFSEENNLLYLCLCLHKLLLYTHCIVQPAGIYRVMDLFH